MAILAGSGGQPSALDIDTALFILIVFMTPFDYIGITLHSSLPVIPQRLFFFVYSYICATKNSNVYLVLLLSVTHRFMLSIEDCVVLSPHTVNLRNIFSVMMTFDISGK